MATLRGPTPFPRGQTATRRFFLIFPAWIRHRDGADEMSCRERQRRAQHFVVARMQVHGLVLCAAEACSARALPLPAGERAGVRGSRIIEGASAPHPVRFARHPLPAEVGYIRLRPLLSCRTR